ncbi:MAG: flagellar basal body L-ring protein FlgH [Fuerstiella sp.]
MKHLHAAALSAAIVLSSGIPNAAADSLWPKRCPNRAYLVDDSRAVRPGDLLTIIISESTQVTNREGKGLSKTSDASGLFNFEGSTGGGLGISAADGNLTFSKSSDRSFDGSANYQNSQRFTDRITVTVVGVSQNGNLTLQGNRTMMISGEQRTLHISGTVRPIDIGPDNTISSQYVSDMMTVYEGTGAEQSFTRQGWFGRKVNKVWPF